ncbi:competence/damage-inducible protein A [Luteolibacter sp. AS25]|uniref:competence/damage-inducible protein A n=1 Tax=Luteolibacter sp. AS25 TaxID=3135776 RepID=UPI00398BA42F
MRIEILNTGTELLLGNTLNTHGGWFGRELFLMGLRVARQATVPDGDAIREAFEEMVDRADALIITGGLGPTSDDLTREIVAETLGLDLHEDEHALRTLETFFRIRNKRMAEANLRQAMVPVGADVLPNPNGTAPGLYLSPRINSRSRCAIFLLPGPPRELYPMFHEEVAPRLRALSGVDVLPVVSELKFTGVGESDFHESVDDVLAATDGLEYGYCSRIGEVDLRLIGSSEVVEMSRNLVLSRFQDNLISDNGKSLEATVIRMLSERKMTFATAESCTGGLIGHRLTNVPGASEVFTHGWITYANEAKSGQLGVPAEMISKHGAVSEEVASAMADGALKESGADISVSVTGIAGPGGGSDEKPVGTAWIGLARKGGNTITRKVFHPRNRRDFKESVSQSALEMVRRNLRDI